MEALKLAFDLVIVGTLALPWLVLAIHLFSGFRLADLWTFNKSEKDSVHPGVAGVLLFTMAYFLGAATARVSEDFFNDEDLPVPITENRIRASVLCSPEEQMNTAASQFPSDSNDIDKRFPELLTACAGQSWQHKRDPTILELDLIQKMFYLEESDLLLQGGDKLDRLNQLHSQIAVMRGAAFDGIIICLLCLFGWCGTQPPRHKVWGTVPVALGAGGLFALATLKLFPSGTLKYILIVLGLAAGYALWKRAPARVFIGIIPVGFVTGGALLLWIHYFGHGVEDPPFMEYTLIVLGLAAGYVVWNGAPARARTYVRGLRLSLLFTWLAYFGWWWTEVRYDQQVIHSFYAQHLFYAQHQTIPTVRK